MFRAQILRRSFSLFRRGSSTPSVVRSAARDGQQTIRIQRVAFKKPFFTKTRLVNAVFWTSGLYAFARVLDAILEDDEEEDSQHDGVRQDRPGIAENADQAADKGEDEVENGDEEEEDDGFEEYDEDEEEDDTLFFFPTGLSRPKRPQFFKASDPEWQEFIKLAPDRDRVDKVRSKLVAIVRARAAKIPQWTQLLGTINPNMGAVWVEVFFPDAPPVEYERPGWELTEDLTLRRATRDVDHEYHSLFNNVLVPTAVAKSIGEDSWRRAVSLWGEAKKRMGWEPKSDPDTVQNIIFPTIPTPPTSNPSMPSPTAPPAATPASSSSAPSTEPQSATSPSSSSSGPTYKAFGITLPKAKELPVMDMRFFRGKWLQRRPRDPPLLPRGAVEVSGMIEIIGERAKLNLEVFGVYDPKTDRYVLITARPRRFKEWSQKPKGGR